MLASKEAIVMYSYVGSVLAYGGRGGGASGLLGGNRFTEDFFGGGFTAHFFNTGTGGTKDMKITNKEKQEYQV